ncbi:MAG: hypothetical protein [Circular genetic element sp.]|nr:MAG: hypothetical protein [Circular genetic element sp.]
MPKGIKETSGLLTISSSIIESGANTFTTSLVDVQLNALDNEVLIVYSVDLDCSPPDLTPATLTESRMSLSTIARTDVGSIAENNVMAAARIVTREVGGAAVTNAFSSDSSPSTDLPYLGIIATNNFALQIQGVNNAGPMVGACKVYCQRGRADSATYAALVQSELLSA